MQGRVHIWTPSCLTSQDQGAPQLYPPPEPVSTAGPPHRLSCPPGMLGSYPTSGSPLTVGGTLYVVCLGTAHVMYGSFPACPFCLPSPVRGALSSQQGVWCPWLGTPASSSCLSSGDAPHCGGSPPFPFSRRIFPPVFLVLQAPPDMETCPSLHRPLPGAHMATPRAVSPPPPISSSYLDSSGASDRPRPYLTPTWPAS